MKLFVLSLLVGGLPPWVSKAVACPDEKGGVALSKVVVAVSDEGGSDIGPRVVGVRHTKPCVVKSKGHKPCVVKTSGKKHHIITTGEKGPGVYTVTIGEADDDEEGEHEFIWYGTEADAEEQGWLGVAIGKVSEAQAVDVHVVGEGVLVLDVVDGSPAEHAGFKVHDVILSIDRDTVEGELGPAVDLIKSRSPGEAVDIVVLRDGRERTLSVELGSRPDAKEPSFKKIRRRGKLRELAESLHTARPKHTFEVQIDGTIEVRIRKGDSVLVRRFEDEDDLARRSPGLYDKYEDLLDAEDEE